jgi:nitric oxide reductase NorD protein
MSMQSDSAQSSQLAGLCMLASALAGRELRVEFAVPGQPAWTDGKVIYITDAVNRQQQTAQICVQAALLAADSLDHAIIKQLAKKPALTKRYLAVEADRALTAIELLLPPSVISFLTLKQMYVTGSALESLQVARNTQFIAEPPDIFGMILPRELLAAQRQEGRSTSAGQHIPRSQQPKPLKELSDHTNEDDDASADFSSPVGGGGGIGKLLQKMFNMVRNVKSGGSPGADAATHWSRAGTRGRARAVQSSATAEAAADVFSGTAEVSYPEWNIHEQCYRMDWCTVQEIAPAIEEHADVDWLEGYGLRKPITQLGMGLDRFHRQRQGDDIDIDALIEWRVDPAAGAAPDDYCYVESQRHRRDLSVLVLLDISGSVTQASVNGSSVHEQQRGVSAALTTVLYEVGDRVALYAFHSQGRSAVHLIPIKRFEENLDSRIMNRLYSLKPGAYSRLGAAIRHSATEIIERGSTSRKLLVVLSDGLAYDHGYEPHYAAADVRKALAEARRDGVGCLCLSVGADTETETLRRVFGSAAHAMIPNPNQLGREIGPLFRAALQAAESRRRIA